MKYTLILITGLVAIAGIYKFNFTNDDIYLEQEDGTVVPIDESIEIKKETAPVQEPSVKVVPITESIVPPTDDLSGSEKIETVVVGPELIDCVGAFPQTCMVVDGEYFYGQIEDFIYEAGYTYTLQIEVTELQKEEIMADASSLIYTLVKEVSKVKVAQ